MSDDKKPTPELVKEEKDAILIDFTPNDLKAIQWLVEISWGTGQVAGTAQAATLMSLASKAEKALRMLPSAMAVPPK